MTTSPISFVVVHRGAEVSYLTGAIVWGLEDEAEMFESAAAAQKALSMWRKRLYSGEHPCCNWYREDGVQILKV